MLINLRNALMTGRRLPYDAEVEYLESSGTQYILLPANNYDGIDIMLEPAESSTYGNIGRRTGTRADSICFNTTNGWGFRAYTASTWTNDTNRSLRHATVHGTTATLDGVSYTLANGWNTVAFANKPFALFGLFNPSTQVMFAYVSCKIGACALYVGSEKVYDFIPVRKGTVGYLYDRVSGKLFGNAGTGDFVLGPDVVPVEYIESHGTEYINAGFATSGNGLRVRLACEKTTSATSEMAVVGRNAGNGFELYISGGRCGLWNDSGKFVSSDVPIVQGTKYSIDALINSSGASLTVNGNEKTSSFAPTEPTAANVLILRHANRYYFVGRVYPCEMWNNDVLTRRYCPVRVGTGSTWEGAMMDVLTRRIYRNAGTGAFTYGNDLKYPIPAE